MQISIRHLHARISRSGKKDNLIQTAAKNEKESNMTMTQYLINFVSKTEQLGEAGIEILDALLLIMLLGSLPIEYENFIVAMELCDKFTPLESLKQKLNEEEARQYDRSAKSNVNNSVLLSKNCSDRK